MAHEDEEMQHDISKLQEKMHQISLSQRATKNEMDVLEKIMEATMDGLKNGMEETMEGLKEGFTKLIQEMIPNGENVVQENHDEKKINVNRDFIKDRKSVV